MLPIHSCLIFISNSRQNTDSHNVKSVHLTVQPRVCNARFIEMEYTNGVNLRNTTTITATTTFDLCFQSKDAFTLKWVWVRVSVCGLQWTVGSRAEYRMAPGGRWVWFELVRVVSAWSRPVLRQPTWVSIQWHHQRKWSKLPSPPKKKSRYSANNFHQLFTSDRERSTHTSIKNPYQMSEWIRTSI